MNELTVIESTPAATNIPATTPLEMGGMTVMERLLVAVQSGLQPELLEKFMELAERQEIREAEKAFNTSYAEYKKNIPTVKPDVKGKIKTKSGFVIEWDYVSLGKLSVEIAKAMAPFGLSFDWDTEQNGSAITVSCFVRHGLGHFRRVSLSCGPDTSGDKSAIHAIKSTITYLKKATLEMASGVSMSEHDDDGTGSGAGYPEQKKRPARKQASEEGKKQESEDTGNEQGGQPDKWQTYLDQWLVWLDQFTAATLDQFTAQWEAQGEKAMAAMPEKYRKKMDIAKNEMVKHLMEKEKKA